MSLARIEPHYICIEKEYYDDDDIFIKFGLKLLDAPNGYGLLADYYKKINSIENELTIILYSIKDAINCDDDTELAEQFLKLTLLKEDICTYICKFKINSDDIDDYFNKIKYENIVPDPDQIVCDLKEEWVIRLEKLSKIYEREKQLHYTKTDSKLESSWLSSLSKMLSFSSSSKPKIKTIPYKPLGNQQ